MVTTNDGPAFRCTLCGEEHARPDEHAAACNALRVAGEAGARPSGVPLRVQAAYVEARQALRANAPAVANQALQWIVSYLAETRGVNPNLTLAAKLAALSEAGIISRTIRPDLVEQARSAAARPEAAWALMTLAEHALIRAYMRQDRDRA